jgi:hypothetical protein
MFRTPGFIFRTSAFDSTERTLPPTRLLIPLAYKQIIPYCTYNRLREEVPSGSKYVEDTVKIKILL